MAHGSSPDTPAQGSISDRGSGAPALPAGPVVKVCGLTRTQDLVTACTLGAWAVGLIFAPSPRRLTPDEARGLVEGARWQMRGAGGIRGVPVTFSAPLVVGVFTEADPEDIAAVVRFVGLDAVQLHGPAAPSVSAVKEAWGQGLRQESGGALGSLGSSGAPWRLSNGKTASAGHPLGEDVADAAAVTPWFIRAVGVAPDERDPASLRERLERAQEEADLVLVDTAVAGRSGGTGREGPWDLIGEAAAGLRFLLAGGIRPANVRQALACGAWGVDVASGVEAAPGIKDRQALFGLMEEVRTSLPVAAQMAVEGRVEAQEGTGSAT